MVRPHCGACVSNAAYSSTGTRLRTRSCMGSAAGTHPSLIWITLLGGGCGGGSVSFGLAAGGRPGPLRNSVTVLQNIRAFFADSMVS